LTLRTDPLSRGLIFRCDLLATAVASIGWAQTGREFPASPSRERPLRTTPKMAFCGEAAHAVRSAVRLLDARFTRNRRSRPLLQRNASTITLKAAKVWWRLGQRRRWPEKVRDQSSRTRMRRRPTRTRISRPSFSDSHAVGQAGADPRFDMDVWGSGRRNGSCGNPSRSERR
jgi:hypothetical protein